MIDSVITGSRGFIGKHLVKRFMDSDVSFSCVLSEHIDTSNLLHLNYFKRFFFLSTYGNLAEHRNWENIVNANVTQFVNMLSQASVLVDCPTFVFVSTSSVGLPVQTAYSRCKRAAEEILLTLAEERRIIIIRPFSVTGVGEQDCHLIPRLIHSCFTGEQVPFTPHPTHDFIDVEDVVSGMITLSENAPSGVYELGTGESWSNQEILEFVGNATGRKANVVLSDNAARPYDAPDWRCTNPSAQQFGWHPTKSITTSIQEMVEHYKATHVTEPAQA